MGDFLGSLWWLVVSLGVLVTFHEYGHYWVARRCGVDVLRFSIGFGRPLWSRRNRAGTEFAVAAIPLGGYVKMLDEREGDVPVTRQAHAFNRQNVWRRIAIVAAGPLANLLLCVALLWAMFLIGRQDYAPVVGRVEGIAAEAGFQPGERLVEVAGREVATWTEATLAMAAPALDRRDIQVRSEDRDGHRVTRTLPLSRLPEPLDERRIPEMAGFTWQFLLAPARIDGVREDGAAGEEYAPQPGLAQLEDLVRQARSSGLAVELSVTGTPCGLSEGEELVIYRIVQEALTNVARHARATTASVRIECRPDAVTVRVDDDGTAAPDDPPVPGMGLLGMRERVTALGGRLHAGPRDQGGFTVQAELPVERAQ